MTWSTGSPGTSTGGPLFLLESETDRNVIRAITLESELGRDVIHSATMESEISQSYTRDHTIETEGAGPGRYTSGHGDGTIQLSASDRDQVEDMVRQQPRATSTQPAERAVPSDESTTRRHDDTAIAGDPTVEYSGES